MDHTESFHLSHHDVIALREKLSEFADGVLAEKDYDKYAGIHHAIRILHEVKLSAYQDRVDRRRIKRAKQREKQSLT